MNAIHLNDTIKISSINVTNYESSVTAESVPISVVQLEPDKETIAALSSNAVDGHKKSKLRIKSQNQNSRRGKINLSA